MLVVAVVGRRIVASYCVVSYCLCASTLVYNSIPFSAYLPGLLQGFPHRQPSKYELFRRMPDLRQGATGQGPDAA